MTEGTQPADVCISAERGRTHGGFGDNATLAMQIRNLWRTMPNWPKMTHVQQLALDEIALKIARLGSSGADPAHQEHWIDIAGYARLGGKLV